MAKHSAYRSSRWGVVIATTALVASFVATGLAGASTQPDDSRNRGPSSAACEAAKARVNDVARDLDRAQRAVQTVRQEAAASNVPAVDPDDTQSDPEGNPSGLDGAADELDGAADVPELGDNEPFGVDDAPETDGSDTSEGSPLDTNEPAVDPDGPDGISLAEQQAIDRAVDARNRVRRNLDNAIERRDRVCAPTTPTTPPVTTTPSRPPVANPPIVDARIVVCVLRPGTCAEVEVDADGRLVRIVREIQCRTDDLPVSSSRRGDRVTVVDHRVIEHHVTVPESNGGYGGSQVGEVPVGSVDTGDGSRA